MLFLVDGYNVTHSDPVTANGSIEQQRDALVARLRVRGRELLGEGRIVVVFDGEGGPGLSTGGGVPVEIVYAHERSADDEIVRVVAQEIARPGKVVVVSSDRDLGERAKAQGGSLVETRDASCCIDGARGKRRGRGRGSVARDVGLPRGANAITKELKDLWLTEDD